MLISVFIRVFILSIFLLLSQIFIFDLIQLPGYGGIMVYPMIILFIPIRVPQVLVLIFGFLVGFLIDYLLGTGGLHAAAMTFMVLIRSVMLRYVVSLVEDKDQATTFREMGIQKFAGITLLLIFAHHLAFYFIERLSVSGFFFTLKRVFSGTLLSVIFILLLTVLFVPDNSKKRA